jgi:hypothetical protein
VIPDYAFRDHIQKLPAFYNYDLGVGVELFGRFTDISERLYGENVLMNSDFEYRCDMRTKIDFIASICCNLLVRV